tara:strand:- start:1695 stop:2096 length:402 start_codon:yes stop_codon:yes gene_type:complete
MDMKRKSIYRPFYSFIKNYDKIENEPDLHIRQTMKLNIIYEFYSYIITNYYNLFSYDSKHFTNKYRYMIFEFSKEYKNEICAMTHEKNFTMIKKVLDTLSLFQEMYTNHYDNVRKYLENVLDDDVISYLLYFL